MAYITLYVQYFRWVGGVVTGDLGKSFFRTMTMGEYLAHRAPISIEIALLATVLSWVIGIPVGLISALQRNNILDYIGKIFDYFLLSCP